MTLTLSIVVKLAVMSCCFTLSTAVVHTLQYFYTATIGIANVPKFISVGILDGVEIIYYDSNNSESVTKLDWMKKLDQQYWDSEKKLSKMYEQVFRVDFDILGERFNLTEGVHVLQKSYGCEWDNDTGYTDGHEALGYDGADFLTLDLENMRLIADMVQAIPTKQKWERSKGFFEYRKIYFHKECIDWLKKYLHYGRSSLETTVHPDVYLLQRNSPSLVVCHATGFYPEEVMITWKRDGVKIQKGVDVGETLPNHDGTFQKRAVLTVSPEERKKGQYTCEVEHKSGNPIVKILSEEDGITLGLIIIICVIALVGIGVTVGIVMKVFFPGREWSLVTMRR